MSEIRWAGVLLLWICAVSTSDWSAELPDSLTALSGLCLTIPCKYSYPGPRLAEDQLTGVWYQGYFVKMVYHSKQSSNADLEFRGRANLVGRLENNDCTLKIQGMRQRDAEKYMFRIESESEKYTYKENTVLVNVIATPPKPSLHCPGTLTEGVPISISCSTAHTCPDAAPLLRWSPIEASSTLSQQQEAHPVGALWEEKAELVLVPSAKSHMKQLHCEAVYPNKLHANSTGCRLIVKHAPTNVFVTVESPVNDITQGDTVNLSCQTDGYPPPHAFSWMRKVGGREEVLLTKKEQEMILEGVGPEPGMFWCRAENAMGSSVAKPTSLDVKYKPVVLNSSWCLVLPTEMPQLSCVCVAQANPPPSLHWTHLGSEDIIHGQLNTSESLGHRVVASVRVTLQVLNTTSEDSLINMMLTCVAKNTLGSASHTYSLEDSVFPRPPAGLQDSTMWQVTGPVLGVMLAIATLAGIAGYLYRSRRMLAL